MLITTINHNPKRPSKELMDMLFSGTSAERRLASEKSMAVFFILYFGHYMKYKLAPFHWEMLQDLQDLDDGKIRELCWVMFRESAKTTMAIAHMARLIAFRKKKYPNVDSYDKTNAESLMFDLTQELQGNEMLIKDFGELFNESRTSDSKTRKKVSDFITTNKIRVEAHSTQEPVRGRKHMENRPDHLLLDDFETFKTIASLIVTVNINKHIEEFYGGLSPDHTVLYLCNYISEYGNVQALIDRSKTDPSLRVRMVGVADKEGGNINWKGKYVWTDAEAVELNKTRPRDVPIVSLQEKKRQMQDTFYPDMLNKPQMRSDIFFDQDKIEEAIANATPCTRIMGGMHIWGKEGEEYQPHHRYAIGADTSEGIGRDSCTSAVIDFSTGELIGTYANDKVAPDVFAHVLRNQGDLFGGCLIAPERNNTGFATVTELKRIYNNIYIEQTPLKIGITLTNRLGFNMTHNTKTEVMYQFKRAFEEGELTIHDRRLLEEMKTYNMEDLQGAASKLIVTRHFDLLIAAAIAWHMRDFAQLTSLDYNDDVIREHDPILDDSV